MGTKNFDFPPIDPSALDGAAGIESFELVEVAGRIKWFDVAKGYGFIVPDSGEADVLLHVTVLRKDGFQTAREGARVVCEAAVKAKGLQVFRVLSMDESTAARCFRITLSIGSRLAAYPANGPPQSRATAADCE